MKINYQINGYTTSVILLSDSYDQGKNNHSWGGGNWDDYQRGQSDRQRNDQINNEIFNTPNKGTGSGNWGGSGSSGGSGNGGGENILGWIFLIILLVPIVITSAISSIFIALILQKYIQTIEPDSQKLTFGKAFNLLFKTTFLYQILSSIILLLLYWMLTNNVEIPFLNLASFNQADISNIIFTTVIFYQLPSILIIGIMLRYKLSDYLKFKGFSGYLRASVITAILIMPVIMLIGYLSASVISYFVYNQPNSIFH
jgi:hypothetical protein